MSRERRDAEKSTEPMLFFSEIVPPPGRFHLDEATDET
jgi:hypothetical protein